MIPLPLDSWEIMLTYLSCHQLIIQGMNSFNTSFALHTMYTIVTLHMYIQALILQNYMYVYIYSIPALSLIVLLVYCQFQHLCSGLILLEPCSTNVHNISYLCHTIVSLVYEWWWTIMYYHLLSLSILSRFGYTLVQITPISVATMVKLITKSYSTGLYHT